MKSFRPLLAAIALVILSAACAPARGDLPRTPTLKSKREPGGDLSPASATVSALIAPDFPELSPVGFVAGIPGEARYVLFDLDGNFLGEWRAPDLVAAGSGYAQTAGGYEKESALPPLAYFAFKDGHRLLALNRDDTITVLRSQGFARMTGAPGRPILAFSMVSEDIEAWNTRLFVGPLDAITASPPALTLDGPAGEGLAPLAVRVKNGQAMGLWYTFEAWGLGGDYLFPPRMGLYYLDLASGKSQIILSREFNPASLSPDQTWLAYSPKNGWNVGSLTVRNLASGEETVFPLLAGNDRGAGSAFFSPDNRYVAWMEGRGHWMTASLPNFQATIRIANTSGEVTAEFPVSAINGIGGIDNVLWMEPVGWADAQTLILQFGPNPNNPAALAKIRFDGRGLAYLAEGRFAGFVYPSSVGDSP